MSLQEVCVIHSVEGSFNTGQMVRVLAEKGISHRFKYIGHKHPNNRAPDNIKEPGVLIGEEFYPAERFMQEGREAFIAYLERMRGQA
jgi:hypothetical protein